MTLGRQKRGGAPVGYLSELAPVEAGAVRCLRLWSEGGEGRMRLWNDLASALGRKEGARALEAFEQLCGLCARHGRRPLMRHSLTCKCLGGDESCFANFIGAASEGDREDATLIASMIVRADMASSLAFLAETFGLALKRMTLKGHVPQPEPEVAATLH